MGMAWPHIENAKHQHYETGLEMEHPGQAKEGETENTWRRDLEADITQTELETTGEDRPGQETLERCCTWPMLQEEPRA